MGGPKRPFLRLRALADWVPRIHPADHADLIYDLRQGSSWGPDFIGMLGLASAIASLGLLQTGDRKILFYPGFKMISWV